LSPHHLRRPSPPQRPRWAARLLALLPLLGGCALFEGARRGAAPLGLERQSREDPALSGDGRLLASLIERGGQPMVVLQEQASGRVLPLRQLRRDPPHRSPSLSWNGRYLAVIAGEGRRRLVLIEDRASGHLHRLPLPPELEPERLSLAPDARRLVLEASVGGRLRLRVLDLTPLLEPDLPAGLAVRGPAAGLAP
jgi:hypothetical protein